MGGGKGTLTFGERATIESMLDAGRTFGAIARELGRPTSTVSREVAANRDYAKRSARGRAPDAQGCPKLASPPGVCNACRARRSGACTRDKVVYEAARASELSALRRSESRSGIDMEPQRAARALEAVRDGLSRHLSPYEISRTMPEDVRVSPATVYDWVERGYGDLANAMLERKVRFRPRKRASPGRAPRRPESRSHEAFLALPEDERGARWEMDTVVGRASDRRRLLTLYHAPTHLQLAVLMADGTCAEAKRCLADVLACAGPLRGEFRPVLTDNGAEFSDWDGIGALLGEGPGGPPLLYFCDPMRSDQKGSCEKAHTELRQVLPKGRVPFDLLVPADVSLACSHVNSNPRRSLAGMSPARAFLAAYGEAGRALLDALGVEEVPAPELVLGPELLNAGRLSRGEEPLRI